MTQILNPPLRKEAFLIKEMQGVETNHLTVALLQKAVASKCSFEEIKELVAAIKEITATVDGSQA